MVADSAIYSVWGKWLNLSTFISGKNQQDLSKDMLELRLGGRSFGCHQSLCCYVSSSVKAVNTEKRPVGREIQDIKHNPDRAA